MNQTRGKWTSASNAEADLLCPGRHRAQQGIEEGPIDEDAAFGAAVHNALAGGEREKLDTKAKDMVEACEEIDKRITDQFFKGFPTVTAREMRLWTKWENLEHSGQVDCLRRRHTQALVLDYKTLPGDVPDSPKNLQLRDLACLAYLNLPLLKEVATVVIQPLVTHYPEMCVYTEADLHRATAEMYARVAASNSEAAPRVPGLKQCKFCRAVGQCEEHAKWIGGVIPIAERTLLNVFPQAWTPAMRSEFLDKLKLAREWLDGCEEMCRKLLEQDPTSIPGWCLKPGQLKHPITKPQEAFDRFVAMGGKLEDFMQCITITKGDLQDKVAATTGEKGARLKQLMKVMLEGLTEEKQNRPSLTRTKE